MTSSKHICASLTVSMLTVLISLRAVFFLFLKAAKTLAMCTHFILSLRHSFICNKVQLKEQLCVLFILQAKMFNTPDKVQQEDVHKKMSKNNKMFYFGRNTNLNVANLI